MKWRSGKRFFPPLPCIVQFQRSRTQQLLIFVQRQRLMRPHHDHPIIAAWQIVLHRSEALAQKPLNAVAAWGGPHLARDAQPQPRMAQIVGQHVQRHRPARFAHARRINGRELRRRFEPMRAREGGAGRHESILWMQRHLGYTFRDSRHRSPCPKMPHWARRGVATRTTDTTGFASREDRPRRFGSASHRCRGQ